MSPAWIDRIIERLGMKRQNSYGRREQNLNTLFTKNKAHHQRIIDGMRDSVVDGSNEQTLLANRKRQNLLACSYRHPKTKMIPPLTIYWMYLINVKPQNSKDHRKYQLKRLYKKLYTIREKTFLKIIMFQMKWVARMKVCMYGAGPDGGIEEGY